MPAPVYRVLGLRCALVETLPIGTNLGVLHPSAPPPAKRFGGSGSGSGQALNALLVIPFLRSGQALNSPLVIPFLRSGQALNALLVILHCVQDDKGGVTHARQY